jgi:uncharacterized SAM-binding protein YcdF (DUF218 family)
MSRRARASRYHGGTMTDERPRLRSASPTVWRVARFLARAAMTLMVAAAAVICAGFAWFIYHVPAEEIALARNADGIVVLTGGASRIADAIELLAAGRGKRLLISGVHRTTTMSEIARINPRYEGLVSCCVDLDRSALNTVGNAVETRRWVKDRGFTSLIVVTSAYHMPRTMAELQSQMPDVELVPFPVVTGRLRNEPWWASAPTARLILSEYAKYVVVQLRLRIEPTSPSDSPEGQGETKG